jgi:hypothetical protein
VCCVLWNRRLRRLCLEDLCRLVWTCNKSVFLKIATRNFSMHSIRYFQESILQISFSWNFQPEIIKVSLRLPFSKNHFFSIL